MKNTIIKVPDPLIIEGKEVKPQHFVASMPYIFKSEFGRFPTPEELASYANAFLKVVKEGQKEIN
jgi:hypothetical protein